MYLGWKFRNVNAGGYVKILNGGRAILSPGGRLCDGLVALIATLGTWAQELLAPILARTRVGAPRGLRGSLAHDSSCMRDFAQARWF